jgi:hypothetical protein
MEGSTKKSFVSSLSRGQAAHLVPGLCAHWHSEHSEQQPRDILQAGARVPPRIHEWYFVIVLICLFVSWILGPLSSPEISSLYLSRAHTRSRPFQGAPFSMAGFLASALAAWAGPETLPVCDLVALWLEGERMKGRGARNTHHLLKKNLPRQPSRLAPLSSGRHAVQNCKNIAEYRLRVRYGVFPWREEIFERLRKVPRPTPRAPTGRNLSLS